jgi:hypothetical protein
VAVSFICCFLFGSASACDYQRVDPSHTMCVYTPRSCGGKTLIRESFSFLFYLNKKSKSKSCMLLGWFCLFLGIRQHINHVAYIYAREIIILKLFFFFSKFFKC